MRSSFSHIDRGRRVQRKSGHGESSSDRLGRFRRYRVAVSALSTQSDCAVSRGLKGRSNCRELRVPCELQCRKGSDEPRSAVPSDRQRGRTLDRLPPASIGLCRRNRSALEVQEEGLGKF
jgi:hypothetical protein